MQRMRLMGLMGLMRSALLEVFVTEISRLLDQVRAEGELVDELQAIWQGEYAV
jgi:hypothetical protein